MTTAKTTLAMKGATFPWLLLALRLYIGGVFLAACFHKIIHPDMFAVDVATYDILPLALINIMAVTLPWIELAAGLMLVLGFRARAAAVLTSAMMLVFIVAISVALHNGLNMSCGCFASQGAGEDPISIMTVFRDLGWFAASMWIVVFDRESPGIDSLVSWLRNRRRA